MDQATQRPRFRTDVAMGVLLAWGVCALLYLDARMRREGLDLGLARYLEFRARREPVADPFPAPVARS